MSYERDNIRAMHGYVYGEQPDDPEVIKLNTNENPLPPSPAVRRALQSFDVDALRRYPPATAAGFRRLAAERHGVDPEQLIVTNGGDELLRLAITTFVEPRSIIATTDPSYSLYPVLAAVQDAAMHTIPFNQGWQLPEEFAAEANGAGAQLTCIVNPHAPSGALLDVNTLRSLARDLNGVLLIDEAYADFVDPDLGYNAIPLTREFDNVLILRTLSKGYSLAGLRFAYGVGSPGLIEPMVGKTRDSYNVDGLAQCVAEAAFGDLDYARESWRTVRENRAELATALRDRGFAVEPSQANFLLVDPPPPAAQRWMEGLREAKVLVRWFDSEGMRSRLRITIGTRQENERLLAGIDTILRSHT